MSLSIPVSASWDLSLGVLMHSYWNASTVPAPDIFVPSVEFPVTMRYMGVVTGSANMSTTVVVSDCDEWIALNDHDTGILIPDFTFHQPNAWLPINLLFTTRLMVFSAGSVQAEGDPIACSCLIVPPMITCADPIRLPTAGTLPMNLRHGVYVGMDVGDLITGLVKIAVIVVMDAIFAAVGGDFSKSKISQKASKEASQQALEEVSEEVASEAAEKTAKEAGAEIGGEAGEGAAKKRPKPQRKFTDSASEAGEEASAEAAEEAAGEASEEAAGEASEEAADDGTGKLTDEEMDQLTDMTDAELDEFADDLTADELDVLMAMMDEWAESKAVRDAAGDAGGDAAGDAAGDAGGDAAGDAAADAGGDAGGEAGEETGGEALEEMSEEALERYQKKVRRDAIMEVLDKAGLSPKMFLKNALINLAGFGIDHWEKDQGHSDGEPSLAIGSGVAFAPALQVMGEDEDGNRTYLSVTAVGGNVDPVVIFGA